MNTLREAALLALGALEGGADSWRLVDPAITALKAALAEPVQEPTVPSDCADSHQPVAWVCYGSSSEEKHAIDYQQEDIDAVPVGTMLYTAPPQRKPLSEGEIKPLVQRAMKYYGYAPERYGPTATAGFVVLARAIERAHGIGGQDE